jgi:hypothetical protein
LKSTLYISFLAVLGSLGYLFFWVPKDEAVNSQLECVKKLQVAVGGDDMAQHEANRFCKVADARLNAIQKNIAKP